MTTTAALREQELGAATTNRMWWLDVNIGTHDDPDWLPVMGLTDFKPARDSELKDSSDYDGGGYKSQTKTAESWKVEAKVVRKVVQEAITYDPGQEFLRAKAAKMGKANTAEVRWYEMEDEGPREEAYQGYGAVTWSPDGGKMDDLNTVSLSVEGQGRMNDIEHPDGGATSAPVVADISPDGGPTAGGDLLTITGANLAGATAVKFGTTDATDFTVVSGGKIVAVTPPGAAGAKQVTVVTPGGTSGTSPASAYTYA